MIATAAVVVTDVIAVTATQRMMNTLRSAISVLSTANTLSYSLVGTNSASFSIDTKTDQLKTKAALDYETTPTYSVTVNVTDRKDEQGNLEQNPTTDASIDVTNVDESGVVTLSTMATVEVGTAITATLSDPDGGVDNESWQWQRRRASTSATWSDIPGPASDSYTLGPGDPGQMLKASVTYVLPVQVATPTLTPGDGSLEVAWVGTGVTASAPDRYEVEYKRVADVSLSRAPDVPHTTTKTTMSGLVNGDLYDARVRAYNSGAYNSGGCGAWSQLAFATPQAKLDAPVGPDIVPMPLRKARLTWTASASSDANTEASIWVADSAGVGSECSAGWILLSGPRSARRRKVRPGGIRRDGHDRMVLLRQR